MIWITIAFIAGLLVGSITSAMALSFVKLSPTVDNDPANDDYRRDYTYTLSILFGLALTAPATAETVLVSRVVDGDTFTIDSGETLSINGVDAPERTQLGGGDSALALHQLIAKQFVELDRSDNQTATVYRDGQDVGGTLVSRGLAYSVNGRYDTLQGEASRRQIGVWSTRINPWQYRARKTAGASHVADRSQRESVVEVNPIMAQPRREVIFHAPVTATQWLRPQYQTPQRFRRPLTTIQCVGNT